MRRHGTRTEGPHLLSAAHGVLAADISLVTSDGSAILGDPVPWDGTLRPDLAVPQRTARLPAHPVHDDFSAGQRRSGAAPVPGRCGRTSGRTRTARTPSLRAWPSSNRSSAPGRRRPGPAPTTTAPRAAACWRKSSAAGPP
ncbi:hypothetical protein ACWCRF_22245 [Streptomyces sp. NPDC002405]